MGINTMDTNSNDKMIRVYSPSGNSFKVLSECPIIMVLLFQIYKKFINVNIPVLVPLIIKVTQIGVASTITVCTH